MRLTVLSIQLSLPVRFHHLPFPPLIPIGPFLSALSTAYCNTVKASELEEDKSQLSLFASNFELVAFLYNRYSKVSKSVVNPSACFNPVLD